MMHEVSHTSAIMKARFMVKSFECLAGAVRFLGWYAPLVVVQGGGGELEVFPTSAVGQRAVSAFFQVHGHSPMM